ncbi:LacI family DNA-binding transcriptional regulator [Anaeropeptidivorans aminofermentans]|uniref:LacI family DNA-binding transcriptional regulator n=1 Tax=Anaeropeptidivorans aminofermentans TaxID=2934315 RepID=UPI0020241388|nr:LacI family DNA-binding transcriptional regulator [Anaeropeptidivorans aminofermentans]MBE6012382.1 LacI family transcriptional regulator [Lachnospiraceae bacterium]
MSNYTISDIAKICGVSKSTVSRVINDKPDGVSEKTKKKILKVIEELNYRPSSLARSVATSHSGLIGLIIPDTSSLFYPEIIHGVSTYLSSHGYSMILGDSQYNPDIEKELLLTMVDKRVDGVILCSGVSNEEFLKEYRSYNIPLASIGRMYDNYLCDLSISGDNVKGARLATQKLIETGNKRIALLSGHADVAGTKQRIEGYKIALNEAGIEFDENLIINGEYTIESGTKMAEKLIESETKFTAVIGGSDLIAIGAIRAIKKAGFKIPKDIEVMGFDNIYLSEVFEPSLSTVSKPHHYMAIEISRKLISLINGKNDIISHFVVEPQIVIRETTKNLQ